ncbi:PorP/SprF family type IX secretion system membrane protein [Fulvivirga ligni]|uniref:PorP/SprF family type IX secretion system membrane protein n=1 Tax=Fulvivirga ligni TaxID=2904246 RepID=UPI001F3EE703|nr:PorP/SprF family type IX secretion system membrane protein [Fulvivirga ligni]UII19989.1 PorP/SprF family type IX secretion system membrane protein [Fulvivirga ligni]
MNTIYNRLKGLAALLVALCWLGSGEVDAQVKTLGSAYFFNQYQVNPSYAGLIEGGLNLNALYHKQATDIGNSSSIQAFTADYGYTDKMGLGINLYRDEQGLIESTRIMATYAYHLPISEGQSVHFGLSLGVIDQKIDMDALQGDMGDPRVAQFNDQGTNFDADFGATYKWNNLMVEAVGLHLGSFASDESTLNIIRKPTVYGAASYKIGLIDAEANSVGITPKVAYRKVEELDGILDVGAQVGFLNDNFNVLAMYHSSKNLTFGLNTLIKGMYGISGTYSTDAKDYDGEAGSDFEVSLQVLLGR